MSYIRTLHKKGLITPPKHVLAGMQIEVMSGSESYGVSSNESDVDIVGVSIPEKNVVFPHLSGEIQGFGRQIKRFDQYQQYKIMDKEKNKEYDFTIYSIIKYFQLCMDNNPNMIDSLFVPRRCILYTTRIGEMIRESRKIFLHKGSFHKLKGYAYSQLNKMNNKKPEGKRLETVKKYGYDVKFAYHTVRLILQCEQILSEGDLDLERNRNQLKAIRKGKWTIEQIQDFFNMKEKHLENLYNSCTVLPHSPDEKAIKQLLINCLEEWFGDIGSAVVVPNQTENLISDIEVLLGKYRG